MVAQEVRLNGAGVVLYEEKMASAKIHELAKRKSDRYKAKTKPALDLRRCSSLLSHRRWISVCSRQNPRRHLRKGREPVDSPSLSVSFRCHCCIYVCFFNTTTFTTNMDILYIDIKDQALVDADLASSNSKWYRPR